MKFKTFITKVKNKATGFIRIPTDSRENFQDGEQLKITIFLDSEYIILFAKVRKCGVLGVYVPRRVMEKHNISGEHDIVFEKTNNFSVRVGKDGRIHIPNRLGKILSLSQDDIVQIDSIIDSDKKKLYGRVRKRERLRTEECVLFIGKQFWKKQCVINNMKKLSKNKSTMIKEINFNSLLRNYSFTEIGDGVILLYLGQRVPIRINTRFSLKDVAHYLGCFFADGTKRGVDWGICASTFAQANYYKKIHSLLIPDNNIRTNITITMKKGDEKSVKKSINLWNKKCNENIKRVYRHYSDAVGYGNRNKYGTLVMKEHRQLTQLYYNDLIIYLLDKIKKDKNTDLAQDFILGVMEGDGCPNASGRGHIQITTNKNEIKLLEEFLKYSELDSKTFREKNGKIYVNVGGLSILENMEKLGPLLFKYYPKRRKRTIERISKTGSARFLTGKQVSTAPWVLKRFREKRILDNNDKLTAKGRKIKKALLQMEKSISK